MTLSARTASALSEEIDQLLEQYLQLLHQYSTLRSELATLQSSVHQHISRANFSAERGVRYGADFYDARLQAIRVCSITVPTPDTATTVAAVAAQSLDDVEHSTAGGGARSTTSTAMCAAAHFTISTAAERKEGVAHGTSGGETTKNDPIRMFGLLAPSSLRLAQAENIKSVEDVIPKLVSIDAEMKELEIRIRRARKYKAKAEAREQLTENIDDQHFAGAEGRQEETI